MAEFTLEMRAMPIWLLETYFSNVGGEKQADGSLQGAGWQATISQMEDFQVGSLRVGQVRLTVTGEEEVLAALWNELEPKLMRAGG